MSRRSKAKFPGINKSVTLKIRHELLDQDYIHLLSNEDKTWLSNFMREYASADFSRKGKALNRTKKSKKAIYDANNARNRDAFAVTKSNHLLRSMSGAELGKEDPNRNVSAKNVGMSGAKSTVPNEVEDTIIAVIDFIKESND